MDMINNLIFLAAKWLQFKLWGKQKANPKKPKEGPTTLDKEEKNIDHEN